MKPIFYLLLLASLFGSKTIVANEAIECYEKAWTNTADGGLGLTTGQAIVLCGGTTDANKVIQCYRKAWRHRDNGGLGLTAGSAIQLCKTNSLSFTY